MLQEDVRSYAVVHARARARYARLLTMETWHELYETQDLGKPP